MPERDPPKTIVYVSFDGILQPLAYSQVARVVVGLRQRGLDYKLVSAERAIDLDGTPRLEKTEAMLQSAGVEWARVRIDSMGSPGRAASVVLRVLRRVADLARAGSVSLLHARGYHGAVVARLAKRLLGIPYLFDTRGYWIEERSGPGQWFGSALGYAGGKLLEQRLFRSASAVVTLTALHASDVLAGLFGPAPPLVETIPTCADYSEFRLRDSRPTKPLGASCVPGEIRRALADKFVVAITGSLNRSYLVDHALRLVKHAAELRPDLHLLVLSPQGAEYRDALRRAGYPAERATIASAPHDEMPAWLDWVDWGLLLLGDVSAKRGSMPTKLAEFFASGVRPLAHGCNAEMESWVRRAGSGHLLDALDDESLRQAAKTIATSPVDVQSLRRARDVTEGHFGLASGIARYERVVRGCLQSSETGPAGAEERTEQTEQRDRTRN